MSIVERMAFVATVVLLTACFPGAASAEHCSFLISIDYLEPSATDTWKIGTTHDISWVVTESCGFAYQVELSRNNQPFEVIGVTDPLLYFIGRLRFPWRVTGPANSKVQFRVIRVLPDVVSEYAYTAPIDIRVTVATRTLSWATLRSRF